MKAFTPRQRQVIHYILLGQTTVEVAKQLNISTETVKVLLRQARERANVNRTKDILQYFASKHPERYSMEKVNPTWLFLDVKLPYKRTTLMSRVAELERQVEELKKLLHVHIQENDPEVQSQPISRATDASMDDAEGSTTHSKL
jgi:DNA-binding CsgD family transcriptional regulator